MTDKIRSLNLEQLGSRIEAIDEFLLMLVAHRMSLSLNVGAYKRATNQPIFRGDREDERLEKVRELAEKFGLSPHFADSMLYNIIGESCKQQMIQLQATGEAPPSAEDEDEWYGILKQNLLKLTEAIAPTYDDQYVSGFFASSAYRNFEDSVLMQEVGKLGVAGTFVDLGCATGFKTFQLASQFRKLIGYDIGAHMIEQANRKLNQRIPSETQFEFHQVDLEEGIPLEDGSVSFVMMNLGTAGDLRGIKGLIVEMKRVLTIGGRFLFSFYNLNALVYRWEFLPWPVSVAAEINHNKRCLDVHAAGKIFSVYARAYTVHEARSFFPQGLVLNKIVTYPTLSPILPNCLFKAEKAREAVLDLDEQLSTSDFGAYIIVTGEKEASCQ